MFNPWVGKIPYRRQWQPTPVFLPGEFHGQRAWWATVHGVAKSRHDWVTNTSLHFRTVYGATPLSAWKPAYACSVHWQDPSSVETSWEVFPQHLKVPRMCKERRAGKQHPASHPWVLWHPTQTSPPSSKSGLQEMSPLSLWSPKQNSSPSSLLWCSSIIYLGLGLESLVSVTCILVSVDLVKIPCSSVLAGSLLVLMC